MSKTAYWYCPNCHEEVDSSRVTWQELHDACGHPVEWIEDIAIDRIREICQAERDGRLVELPCKEINELRDIHAALDNIKAGRTELAEEAVDRWKALTELVEENERLKKENERLKAERTWIPVTERLPEDDPTVKMHKETYMEFCSVLAVGMFKECEYAPPSVSLVNRIRQKKTGISFIDKEIKSEDWRWSAPFESVTHWMPLPEPPKEGE